MMSLCASGKEDNIADSSSGAGIASVFLRLFVLFGQSHFKQIWKPRSIGYRGHGIINCIALDSY